MEPSCRLRHRDLTFPGWDVVRSRLAPQNVGHGPPSLVQRTARTSASQSPAPVASPPMPTTGEPVKITGTTTFGAAATEALFHAHDKHTRGLLVLVGQLVPEPENAADPTAVAVHVEGGRVGYLPGYLADQLLLAPGDLLPCQVQLWGATDRGQLRVLGWVAHGTGPVAWPHTSQNPPAVTIAEQRAERAAATTDMVDDGLTSEDPERAAQFRRGMAGRYHYLETLEPIQQLMRDGRLQEALDLCYGAIDAAEQDRNGREPAPWYTEQAAIIHRKRGERDREVALLQRWLSLCPPERRADTKIGQRLDKTQTDR